MKLAVSTHGCESRLAQDAPARAGSTPGDDLGNKAFQRTQHCPASLPEWSTARPWPMAHSPDPMLTRRREAAAHVSGATTARPNIAPVSPCVHTSEDHCCCSWPRGRSKTGGASHSAISARRRSSQRRRSPSSCLVCRSMAICCLSVSKR